MENVEIRMIDGQEVEVFITDLPFLITRGKKGFYYTDLHGKVRAYNIFLEEGLKDERWYAELVEKPCMPQHLKAVFKPKVGRSLDTLVRYCVKCYLRSLDMWKRDIQRQYCKQVPFKKAKKYTKAKRTKQNKLKWQG